MTFAVSIGLKKTSVHLFIRPRTRTRPTMCCDLSQQRAAARKRPAPEEPMIPRTKIQQVKQRAVAFIVANNLPFSVFEGPEGVAFLRSLSPHLTNLTPLGHTSLRQELTAMYKAR